MRNLKPKKRSALVFLFIIFSLVSIFYYCCSASENIISIVKIASLDGERFDFTIISMCESVKLSAPTPYVSVQVRNVEILRTAVSSGYDSVQQCVNSSIERVNLSKNQKQLLIYMKNGEVKEIDILGYER